jgi:hypothetical protein
MIFQRAFKASKANTKMAIDDKEKTEASEIVDMFAQKYGKIEDFISWHEKPGEFSSEKVEQAEKKNDSEAIIKISLRDKFTKVKKEFIEWTLLTKFDCFSKIFQTKKIAVQLIWLSLVLIFTALTAYFVTKNFLDYFTWTRPCPKLTSKLSIQLNFLP